MDQRRRKPRRKMATLAPIWKRMVWRCASELRGIARQVSRDAAFNLWLPALGEKSVRKDIFGDIFVAVRTVPQALQLHPLCPGPRDFWPVRKPQPKHVGVEDGEGEQKPSSAPNRVRHDSRTTALFGSVAWIATWGCGRRATDSDADSYFAKYGRALEDTSPEKRNECGEGATNARSAMLQDKNFEKCEHDRHDARLLGDSAPLSDPSGSGEVGPRCLPQAIRDGMHTGGRRASRRRGGSPRDPSAYHRSPIKQNVAYRPIKHNVSKWPLYA